jgi:uncharacterized membrane protein YbhN (UPF0104 family)
MPEEIHQERKGTEPNEAGVNRGEKQISRLWNVIKFIVALILVAVVFSQTDLQQLITLRESLSFSWLAGYFSVFCLLVLIKAFQYWALFRGKVSFRGMLRIVVWQNSLSNLIAAGAGIASYLAMLRAEQGVKLSSSGLVFIVTKVGEVLIIGIYLALSTWFSWSHIESLQILVLVLLVGILVGFSIFIFAVTWRESFIKFIQRVVSWMRLNRISFVNRVLKSLHSLAKADQKEVNRLLVLGVGISFLYVSVTNVLIVAGLKIFSIDVGIWAVIFVASFLQLFANIPIQILGGLGVSEITSVFIYGLFGIDTSGMAAAQLGLRAVFYLSNASLLLYLPVEGLLSRNQDREEKVDS